MNSTHAGCIHHENHEARIERNEEDIKEIKSDVKIMRADITKIVGGLTVIGLAGNYLIQILTSAA